MPLLLRTNPKEDQLLIGYRYPEHNAEPEPVHLFVNHVPLSIYCIFIGLEIIGQEMVKEKKWCGFWLNILSSDIVMEQSSSLFGIRYRVAVSMVN